MTNNAGKISRIVAIVLAAHLAISIVVFGMRRDDYSHARNTISELGEFGAADSALVSWSVFFPVGVALAAIAILIWIQRNTRSTAALAACIAAGYLVAAFFPCDPGSPLSGTSRQAIHNWGGAIEYFGGAVALIFLARSAPRFRGLFFAAGAVVLAVACTISMSNFAEVRGLLQRFGETALFGSLIVAAGLNTPAQNERR